MNEFERVRLHPHWHGLAAVYGDFSTLYSGEQSIQHRRNSIC